jgi:antitoxin (DNA-binding transcriptional repressor) of toxin-antitoxin stability system
MAQLERTMEAFAVRDLREHTGELVRNAESGALSLVSKHGKPLFIAVPFSEKLLDAGVGVAYADRLVQSGELSVSAGAKIAGMPYARYLQHLGAIGYSMVDESADLAAELALLPAKTTPKNRRSS